MASRREVEDALRRLAPKIPSFEFNAIADHAIDSAGLSKASPETAAWLSMVAFVRHALTDYDALLHDGYDQAAARHFVAAEIEDVLAGWGVRRKLTAGE
ncbi:DUF2293 domain-containing protein [Rhodomicrobium sp. Az07]|uniref:DUF2293 domain-containing protein n=1 Tax=Rhodomicrobium sp. Az07 TaxID=2839034 RepID=UPI001BE964C7|nr:DUF2293 domain-containing protein [Rhodomicrobium sp. Az07]MBT3071512.1 DUF2293 domain-containing protein [Rhodomicrobium sp. Az07]